MGGIRDVTQILLAGRSKHRVVTGCGEKGSLPKDKTPAESPTSSLLPPARLAQHRRHTTRQELAQRDPLSVAPVGGCLQVTSRHRFSCRSPITMTDRSF